MQDTEIERQQPQLPTGQPSHERLPAFQGSGAPPGILGQHRTLSISRWKTFPGVPQTQPRTCSFSHVPCHTEGSHRSLSLSGLSPPHTPPHILSPGSCGFGHKTSPVCFCSLPLPELGAEILAMRPLSQDQFGLIHYLLFTGLPLSI